MGMVSGEKGPVLIDPGHGGADTGARGPGGLVEKDVNLLVAREVAARLKAAGVAVSLTRLDDHERSAVQRAEMAAAERAVVLVSVHTNASARPGMRGTECYFKAGCPDSARLAGLIQRAVTEACGRPDRGRRAGSFAVLRRSPVPAVLVELAFISDPEEEALLSTGEFRRAAAGAITAAIRELLR